MNIIPLSAAFRQKSNGCPQAEMRLADIVET